MTNFVRDNTSLATNKHDIRPMPPDPTGVLGSDEWKTVCQALYDVRGIIQASGFYSVSSDPSSPVAGQSWYNSVSNKFKLRDGTSTQVLVGYRAPGAVLQERFPIVSNQITYGFDTPFVVGAIAFDPAQYMVPGTTRTMTFRAIMASGSGIAARIILHNLTDDEIVVDTTTTLTIPQIIDVPLTIGNGTGNIKNDGSPRIYEIGIFVSNPIHADDVVTLYGAELRVLSTV